MALKPEQKIFIKHYLKSGDHIAAYQKAVPGTNRKVAASSGKRWLKKADIAAEIARLSPESTNSTEESINLSTQTSEKPRELEPRERRFAEEYIIDLNAAGAAKRAGHSEKSARYIGYELLAKPHIQDYIQELNLARSRRTEVTADMVVQELACIAFAKVTDFIRVETKTEEHYTLNKVKGLLDEDEEDGDEGKPVEYKAVDVFETDGIPENKIRAVASIKQGRSGIEVKLHSKEKALELLGRHLGMWNDKLAIDPSEELKNLYKALMGGEDM